MATALPVAAFIAANAAFILLFPSMRFLELVRLAYEANTLYLPALSLLCAGVVALEGRRDRRMLRRAAAMALYASVLAGIRLYATHIEPHRLHLRRASIAVPGLDRRIRILHISDIQSAAVGSWEDRVVDEIRRIDPDLVVNTGDLLQPLPPATIASELPKLTALMERVHPPLGKFTVDGDVDYWVARSNPRVIAAMRRLASEDVAVEAGVRRASSGEEESFRIRILGLTLEQSAHGSAARIAVERWLAGTAPGDFTIVAGHRPDFAMALEGMDVNLVLAGHTHGGQVRLPFLGPPVILSRVPREWARGFRPLGGGWLDVSAGIGCEHTGGMPCIRVNCPPEMTLITLQPAGDAPPGPPRTRAAGK